MTTERYAGNLRRMPQMDDAYWECEKRNYFHKLCESIQASTSANRETTFRRA